MSICALFIGALTVKTLLPTVVKVCILLPFTKFILSPPNAFTLSFADNG